MNRIFVFVYGGVAYVMFLAVFLYMIGFLGNFIVPRQIDSLPNSSLGDALVVNVALLLLFGVQHTVMARPTFKRWWTKFVPEPIERSTYLVATCAILGLIYWQWQATDVVIWDVQHSAGRAALWSVFALGWGLVLIATCMINHFDLFGLRQVWLYLRGREYHHVKFGTTGFYKHIRHPLYVGWFTAFWATPTMSASHLMFAAGTTIYMLIAIYYEERNLIEFLGEPYINWRKRTPMFIHLTPCGHHFYAVELFDALLAAGAFSGER